MRNKKGFTLVELMISVSILIILISMLTVIFRATQESFVKASSLQKVFDTSRNIIQRMHDEISAAFFDPAGKTALVGFDSEVGQLNTDSIGDEIYFCVPLSEVDRSDICEIGYWLRTDGNLMRHYEEEADYDFETGLADDELGLIVENFEISYFDGENYLDTWDSRIGAPEEGLAPKAVKVSFLVSDESKFLTKTFNTVVHISSGKRY